MNKDAYISAILTEPGDWRRYKYNAYFKSVLDSYIEMIPIFVDGLREHAEIEDRRMKALIEKARFPPNKVFNMPDGWNDT